MGKNSSVWVYDSSPEDTPEVGMHFPNNLPTCFSLYPLDRGRSGTKFYFRPLNQYACCHTTKY